MKSHLKVKVHSLSSEMTYIRRQEEKWKNRARHAREKQKADSLSYAEANFWSQRWHRVDLKTAARTTHLAYGAMKGVPYSKMEVFCYGAMKGYGSTEPNWAAIAETVERFSKDEPKKLEIMQRFGEWLADAKKWYEGNPERIADMWSQNRDERERLVSDPDYQQRKRLVAARYKDQNGVSAA